MTTIRTIGASGQMVTFGRLTLWQVGVPPAWDTIKVALSGNTVKTINTLVANAMELTGQFSVADGANSLQCMEASIEWLSGL